MTIPSGYTVRTLAEAPDGSILAGTSPPRIYRSTDGGVNWTLVQTIGATAGSTVEKISFSPIAGYAAVTGEVAERGIWRSTDNGQTWVREESLVSIFGSTGGSFVGAVDVAAYNQTNVESALVTLSATQKLRRGMRLENVWYFAEDSDSPLIQYSGVGGGIGNNSIATWRQFEFSTVFVGYSQFNAVTGVYLQTINNNLNRVQTLTGVVEPKVIGRHYPTTPSPPPKPTPPPRLSYLIAGKEVSSGNTLFYTNLASTVPLNTSNFLDFRLVSQIAGDIICLYAYSPAPTVFGQLPPGIVDYVGALNKIYISTNYGVSWSTFAEFTNPTPINCLLRTSTGFLLAGSTNGRIFRFEGQGSSPGGSTPTDPDPGDGGTTPPTTPPSTPVTNTAVLGRSATSTGLVTVTNKQGLSNISYVINYTGSAFERLQFAQNPPYQFFGSPPVAGEMVYFGCRTDENSVPSGPFSSVFFSLTLAAFGISTVWEYWDGSTWETLDVSDGTNGFSSVGEFGVHWIPPSDWETTTVDSVPGYWVRVRITGIDGDIDPGDAVAPVHDSQFIFTANLPYVEIGSTRVKGLLPALGRVIWTNQADNPGSSPSLPVDRMLIGLRSYDRGENFSAYLNITDVSSPFGVTITPKFGGGSFVDHPTAPTARAFSVSHTADETLFSWNNLAEISLSTTVAKDYYGVFRGFLRCFIASPGTSLTWRFRLMISFGSGGGSTYTKEFYASPVNTEFVTLDLGRVSVPNSTLSTISGNVGDQLTITVQGYCTTKNVAARLYDVILVPADEWLVDTQLPNILDQTIDNKVNGKEYLDIDSINNPKSYLTAFVRQPTGQIKSIYQSVSNGPVILQTGVRQKLWFFGMLYNYTTKTWLSDPAIAGSVRLSKVQRYTSLRGNQ